MLVPLRNAGEPGHAGPPGQMHEHRLDMVVARVGGGDEGALEPGRCLTKELVPRLTPRFLEADLEALGDQRHIRPTRHERDSEFVRERLALRLLFVRLRALSMVEMPGDQIDAAGVQEMEKGGAVGTPAVADEHTHPGRDEAARLEVLLEPLAHAGSVAHHSGHASLHALQGNAPATDDDKDESEGAVTSSKSP